MSGCRMMSDNALPERGFRGLLVEACRSESGDVGVKIGVNVRSQVGGFQRTGLLPAIADDSGSSPTLKSFPLVREIFDRLLGIARTSPGHNALEAARIGE